MSKGIETGISARQEVELTSGRIRNVYDLNIEPTRDPLGIALDIAERKRAEERIRELGAIVESSDVAILGKTLLGDDPRKPDPCATQVGGTSARRETTPSRTIS